MIYTVISDTLGRENLIECKKDCRLLRQSEISLPENILKYIDKSKNPGVKEERLLAYTSLFGSLKLFFDIDEPKIGRQDNGKPILLSHNERNINFNISHSDGMVAVTLSDEGEVGVDIQAEIVSGRQEQLDKRFLSDLQIKSENLSVDFYFCTLSNSTLEFRKIELRLSDGKSFFDRWTALESVLKLDGGGFGSLSFAPVLMKNVKTDIRKINLLNKSYSLSNSIKNG